MAHNLEERNGKASFISVREVAWHGLGMVLDKPPTFEEAIKKARLDYVVAKSEVYAKDTDKIVKDYYATYRTDTNATLGLVGSRYEIVQNHEAFKVFDPLMQADVCDIQTAGVLGNGEQVFLTAKMKDSIYLKDDCNIDKYLLFTNSHDGSGKLVCTITPIRVVCNNTLTCALKGATNKFAVKHTKSVHDKLVNVDAFLNITNTYYAEMMYTYNKLIDVKVTTRMVDEVLFGTFLTASEIMLINKNNGRLQGIDEISTRKKNVITEVKNVIFVGAGQDTKATVNTAYGIFQGVNTYLNNVKSYTDSQDRFSALTDGNAIKTTEKVLELCLAL